MFTQGENVCQHAIQDLKDMWIRGQRKLNACPRQGKSARCQYLQQSHEKQPEILDRCLWIAEKAEKHGKDGEEDDKEEDKEEDDDEEERVEEAEEDEEEKDEEEEEDEEIEIGGREIW